MEERILVVDDNLDAADSLAILIRTLGYETKACYSGQQAIDETAAFVPDMVLLDIGMPGLDGFETVSRIRQQRGGDHVIVVAVTGWTRDEDKKRAYDAGFDLHVAKPLHINKLNELLSLLDPSRGSDTKDRSELI